MRSTPRAALLATALTAVVLPTVARAQTPRRPTPHEAITRALAPVEAALADLHVTENERASVADLLARGESWAADVVEAGQHGDRDVVRARTRALALLARLARGRVEALRAEGSAAEAERAAVAAVERRVDARAALERVVERRVALDRADPVDTRTLPAPEPEAAHSAAPTAAPDQGAPGAPGAQATPAPQGGRTP